MRPNATLLPVISLSFLASVSLGQDLTSVNPVNPGGTPGPKLDLSLGAARSYVKPASSSFYYKLNYLGKDILNRGTNPTFAVPGLTPYTIPEIPGSDKDYRLTITDGVGQLSGPLLDGLDLKEFDFLPESFSFLKGTINVVGQPLSGGQVNFGGGLETDPIRLPLPDWRIAKVLRLGVLGEKVSNAEDPSGNRDVFSFTYRAYVGTGFAHVRSENLDKLKAQVDTEIRGRTLTQAVEAITGNTNSIFKGFLGLSGFHLGRGNQDPAKLYKTTDQVESGPIETNDAFSEAVEDVIDEAGLGNAFNHGDQPTIVLEAIAEGTYSPVHFDTRRYNALYEITLGWYLNPRKPDTGKLSIGYQNGYNRGAPTQSLNGAYALLSVKF